MGTFTFYSRFMVFYNKKQTKTLCGSPALPPSSDISCGRDWSVTENFRFQLAVVYVTHSQCSDSCGSSLESRMEGERFFIKRNEGRNDFFKMYIIFISPLSEREMYMP